MPFGKQPSFHRFETGPDTANWLGPWRFQPGGSGIAASTSYIVAHNLMRAFQGLNIAYRLHRIIAGQLHQEPPLQKPPKKVVVKAGRFPYLFLQMHRVGARVNRFYPENACTGKVQQTTN